MKNNLVYYSMKKIVLTVALLIGSLAASAQIGVITLEKGKQVPLEMWYTIDEKGRNNNIYITYDNEDAARFKLENILREFDMEIDVPSGTDETGDDYWSVEQENGFISDIFYTKAKGDIYVTITIVSSEK